MYTYEGPNAQFKQKMRVSVAKRLGSPLLMKLTTVTTKYSLSSQSCLPAFSPCREAILFAIWQIYSSESPYTPAKINTGLTVLLLVHNTFLPYDLSYPVLANSYKMYYLVLSDSGYWGSSGLRKIPVLKLADQKSTWQALTLYTKGRLTHSMPFPCRAVPLRV